MLKINILNDSLIEPGGTSSLFFNVVSSLRTKLTELMIISSFTFYFAFLTNYRLMLKYKTRQRNGKDKKTIPMGGILDRMVIHGIHRRKMVCQNN